MAVMGKAILLVEDSDDDVLFFARAVKLAEIGNQVVRVSTGEEAISYLTGQGIYADRAAFPVPFAVILDLRLPGGSGLDVLKWIRSQSHLKDLLVIVLTGSERTTTIHDAYQCGANSFLRKPCKAEDLRTLTVNFPGAWQTSTSA
jgi:CheY-like chemotaxis protein